MRDRSPSGPPGAGGVGKRRFIEKSLLSWRENGECGFGCRGVKDSTWSE